MSDVIANLAARVESEGDPAAAQALRESWARVQAEGQKAARFWREAYAPFEIREEPKS